MLTFSKALELTNIKHKIVETPAGFTVQLLEEASTDASSVQCLLDLATSVYGYALDQRSSETASSEVVFYFVTKDSPRYVELADANTNSEEDDEIFDDDGDEADDGSEEGEGEAEDEEDDEGEELEDRDLRVLIGPEHHKMAQKIYNSVCNNDNLGKYPAFLIDFDQFLQRYFKRPPVGHDFDSSEFGEEANAEVAALIEEAKKQKNGRAGFLSMFMKLISGDEGDSIVNAFDAGDSEKLQELLGIAVGKAKAAKVAE